MTARQYTKCQQDGCSSEDVQEWTIEGYDPVPVFVFCTDHAREFGFCLHCGAFIGGTEDVFLTRQDGICFECFTRQERATYEIDYDDEFDDTSRR